MHRPSEKPENRLPVRVLIGLLLATFGCAASGKSVEEKTDRLELAIQKHEKKEPCAEQLREAMKLCLDMCKMRNIGAVSGDFDERACEKKCANGTSAYPKSLKGLFKKCGEKPAPEKESQQLYKNPRKKQYMRKRVA